MYGGSSALRKKRDSKRRWIARCRIGRPIPRLAIMNFELDRKFKFMASESSYLTDYYVAVGEIDKN